jgi:hypothetical protein
MMPENIVVRGLSIVAVAMNQHSYFAYGLELRIKGIESPRTCSAVTFERYGIAGGACAHGRGTGWDARTSSFTVVQASIPESHALPSPTGLTISEQNATVKGGIRVAAAYSHNKHGEWAKQIV